jgi:hypothetical protein
MVVPDSNSTTQQQSYAARTFPIVSARYWESRSGCRCKVFSVLTPPSSICTLSRVARYRNFRGSGLRLFAYPCAVHLSPSILHGWRPPQPPDRQYLRTLRDFPFAGHWKPWYVESQGLGRVHSSYITPDLWSRERRKEANWPTMCLGCAGFCTALRWNATERARIPSEATRGCKARSSLQENRRI